MKLTKKPWNTGPEVKHGTKTALAYAKYGAEALSAQGNGSKRTNLTALLATRRQLKKVQKKIESFNRPPAGRVQRAIARYYMED